MKTDRERSERENFLGHNFSLSWGWGLEGRISRGPLVIFWYFCRLTPAEAPVRRVFGDENGVFF